MITPVEIQLVEAAASGSDQSVTRHTSHVTRHTSHVTRHTCIKKEVKIGNLLLLWMVLEFFVGNLWGQGSLVPSEQNCSRKVIKVEYFDGSNWITMCEPNYANQQSFEPCNYLSMTGRTGFCEGDSLRVTCTSGTVLALLTPPNVYQGALELKLNGSILLGYVLNPTVQIMNSNSTVYNVQSIFQFRIPVLPPNSGYYYMSVRYVDNSATCISQLDTISIDPLVIVETNLVPYDRYTGHIKVIKNPIINQLEGQIDCKTGTYNILYEVEYGQDFYYQVGGADPVLLNSSNTTGMFTVAGVTSSTPLNFWVINESECKTSQTITLYPALQASMNCTWESRQVLTSYVNVSQGSGNYTFTWILDGGAPVVTTSSSNTFTTSTQGYTLTVIVTDNLTGCKDTLNCSENLSCCPVGSIVINNTQDLFTYRNLLNHPDSTNRLNVCITENITASANVYTFRNCKIYMINERSALMFVEDANFINCNIEGCERLWNSISIVNNKKLTVDKTQIRDAVYALVVWQGSDLVLDSSVLTNNYIGVATNSNRLRIVRTRFNGGGLKDSSQTPAEQIGIQIRETQNATIGDNTNASFVNNFINLWNGIIVSLCNNITIQGGIFRQCTTGVYLEGDMNLNMAYLNNNTFRNCTTGIGLQQHGMAVVNNVFRFCTRGLSGNHVNNESLILKQNIYRDCQIASSILGNNNPVIDVRLEKVSSTVGTSGGHAIISFNTLNNTNNHVVTFENNTYQNVAFGILFGGTAWTDNALPTQQSKLKFINNNIRLSGFNNGTQRASYGIGLIYCSRPYLSANNISLSNINLGAPTVGIYTDFTDNAHMESNTFEGKQNFWLTHGIWAGSEALGNPQYYCNTFDRVENALTYNWALNALDSLAMGSYMEPVGNRFRKNRVTWHTFAWETKLNKYTYYYGKASSISQWDIKPYNNFATSNSIYDHSSILTNIVQTINDPACVDTLSKRLKLNVAKGEIQGPVQRRNEMRIALMKEMLYDSSLINAHADYHNFYNQYRISNVYQLAFAKYLAEQNDSLASASVLDTMAPDTSVSNDMIEFHKILLKDSLSTADKQFLYSFGSQCEILNGCSPIVARQLLYMEGDTTLFTEAFLLKLPNYCTTSNKTHFVTGLDTPEEIANLEIHVYPNPVSGSLYVIHNSEKALFAELINIHGQVVKTVLLEGNTEISVEDLPNGVYILRSVYAEFEPIKIVVNK